MMEKSVKVFNISAKVTNQDIVDFFKFAGVVSSAVFKSDEASTYPTKKCAILTFTDGNAVEASLLLSGTVVGDQPIHVLRLSDEDYHDFASQEAMVITAGVLSSTEPTHKSESVVASLLASGYLLSKDALEKARALDESHGISQTASTSMAAVKEKTAATAAALDKRFNISERMSGASASVSNAFSSVDNTYHVSSKAKAAAATAEASLSQAAQHVMKNPYIASGRDWMVGTFERVKQQTLEQVKKPAA